MNRGRKRKRVSLDDDDGGGDDGISCFLHDHNGGGVQANGEIYFF